MTRIKLHLFAPRLFFLPKAQKQAVVTLFFFLGENCPLLAWLASMKFVRPQTDKYLHQVEVESRLACCNHSRQQCYCNGLISQPKCDSSLLITHLTGVIWGKDDYSKKLPNNRLWRVISVRVFQVKLEQWYKGRPWPSSSSCSFVSDRKYNSQRKLKAVYMGTFLWVLTQGVKI